MTSLLGALAPAAVLLTSSCALFVSFDDRERQPRSLRGTVFGLVDATVSLRLGANVEEVGNGPFAFPAILPYGTTYSLTIAKQPAGQRCSIRGGEGDVAGYDVDGVEVHCTIDPPTDCDGGADTATQSPCP